MRRTIMYSAVAVVAAIVLAAAAVAFRAPIYNAMCDTTAGETVLACVRAWQSLAVAAIAILMGLAFLLTLRRQAAQLHQQQLQIRRQFGEYMRQMTEADRRVVLRETARTEEKLDKAIERIARFEKDVEEDPEVQNDPVQALRMRLANLESIAAGESITELRDYFTEEENRNIRELLAELRVQSSLLSKVLPKFQTALSTLKTESQEHRRMMRQVFAEMQNLHLSKQETVLKRSNELLESIRQLRSRWQNAWYLKDTMI
jgi:hypothetical protein